MVKLHLLWSYDEDIALPKEFSYEQLTRVYCATQFSNMGRTLVHIPPKAIVLIGVLCNRPISNFIRGFS